LFGVYEDQKTSFLPTFQAILFKMYLVSLVVVSKLKDGLHALQALYLGFEYYFFNPYFSFLFDYFSP
jgi:hypothetical protein